eukprot:scaffold11667_cov328-Ochromonas_danica.AAC.3
MVMLLLWRIGSVGINKWVFLECGGLVLDQIRAGWIETIHNKGKLVHRDIKPENFLMGRGRDRHTVYVIDFGLSKQFCNPRTGRHISARTGYSLTGTARYASIHAHEGKELSRRDDLISIGYVLVYFIKGALPWQGLHGSTSEEKYRLIYEKKQSTSLSELCEGIPEAFLLYLEAVTALTFEEIPDYAQLKIIPMMPYCMIGSCLPISDGLRRNEEVDGQAGTIAMYPPTKKWHATVKWIGSAHLVP